MAPPSRSDGSDMSDSTHVTKRIEGHTGFIELDRPDRANAYRDATIEAMGDALAVVLLERKQFRESDFRRNHPGGSLGERLKVNVSEVMLTGDYIPVVKQDSPLKETVDILNDKNLGAVLIVDDLQRVAGIITDGDVRRMVAKSIDLHTQTAGEHMTSAPKTITRGLLAADALSIMQDHEITILPVTEEDGRLAGLLHLHDLLGKGEFRFLV